jgi:hypothetical protein
LKVNWDILFGCDKVFVVPWWPFALDPTLTLVEDSDNAIEGLAELPDFEADLDREPWEGCECWWWL